MKQLMIGAVLALTVAAAGCGDGGGGKALTKEEYAAKLNAICNEANKTFRQIGSGTLATFKEKGDDVVAAAEKAASEFHHVKALEELRSAAGTFNDSSDEIVDDFKNMTDKAKKGDEAGFTAANTSLQNHGKENSEAATEIGATDC